VKMTIMLSLLLSAQCSLLFSALHPVGILPENAFGIPPIWHSDRLPQIGLYKYQGVDKMRRCVDASVQVVKSIC